MVDWFIFIDDRLPANSAINVHFRQITLAQFNARATERLKLPIAVNWGYKLCDFKPLYGLLFSDELAGFEFWGHCDLDIAWGRVRQFLTDPLLAAYDVISCDPRRLCGPLTLFRNSGFIRNLPWRADLTDILCDDRHRGFDEIEFDLIVKAAAANGELRLLLARGHEWERQFADNVGDRGCAWHDGRLFSLATRNEIAFFHFYWSKQWAWKTTWQSSAKGAVG
jgi:hypothetical protein